MKTTLTASEVIDILHSLAPETMPNGHVLQLSYHPERDEIVSLGRLVQSNTELTEPGHWNLGKFYVNWLRNAPASVVLTEAERLLACIAQIPEAARRRAPGAGRKPKHASGPTVPLGVNKVAPDVAALVAAAEQPTAYVEAAIRFYNEHNNL